MSDKKRIFYSFWLNNLGIIIEIITGLLTGSLAILSDAFHNVVDSLIMLTTMIGLSRSKKAPTKKQTYGSGRITVLITLFNGALTIALAFFIFFEAYKRFITPTSINSSPVIFAAAAAVILNGLIAYISSKGEDLSTKIIFLPNLADAASALSIVIGYIILFLNPRLTFIDPLLSIIIGFMLIHSVYEVLTEAVDILMEKTPNHFDLNEIIKIIKNNDEVVDVYDVHAWSISSGIHALSAHIVIDNCSLEVSNKVSRRLREKLRKKFFIEHTTLEIECQHAEGNEERHIDVK